MKIVVIGATGTIGKGIVNVLQPHHEIIPVGHTGGDFRVDLGSKDSITGLFQDIGTVDAIVSAAGLARFGTLAELSEKDFLLGLHHKLMGQVHLVQIGVDHIADLGSITLTSGVLSREPIPGSAAISMANAGLEGFVRAAALESPRGIRINAVSPIWVSETLESMGKDGSDGIPSDRTALAYKASVEGTLNGEVLDVRDYASSGS
jgi:NAD(P)-dependent dehydrogenase (short-subunit alcohol dehydrogenase family)